MRKSQLEISKADDDLVYMGSRRFFGRPSKLGVQWVADCLGDEFDVELSREQVYGLVWEAIERGFVFFSPPYDLKAAQRIKDFYRLSASHKVVVAAGPEEARFVLAHQLHKAIVRLAGEEPFRLAVGPGYRLKRSFRMLGNLLRGESSVPDFHVRSLALEELYGSYPDALPETFARCLEIDGSNTVYFTPRHVNEGFRLAVWDVCEPIRNDVDLADAHVVLLAADPLRHELIKPWLEEGAFSLAVLDRQTATRLVAASSATDGGLPEIEESLHRCCPAPR